MNYEEMWHQQCARADVAEQKVKKLKAQLAAEASAVEELKQAYKTAREMPCDANPFSEGRKSGYVRGLLDALDIVTNHRVAALVQAE